MGGCGSDDRAKSVNIDGTVIAEGLVFGLLAGEQVENGGKGLLAYLLDALFAGDDTAGVDVHIVRQDRKSTRLNSSHNVISRMPSSA